MLMYIRDDRVAVVQNQSTRSWHVHPGSQHEKSLWVYPADLWRYISCTSRSKNGHVESLVGSLWLHADFVGRSYGSPNLSPEGALRKIYLQRPLVRDWRQPRIFLIKIMFVRQTQKLCEIDFTCTTELSCASWIGLKDGEWGTIYIIQCQGLPNLEFEMK